MVLVGLGVATDAHLLLRSLRAPDDFPGLRICELNKLVNRLMGEKFAGKRMRIAALG